MLCRKWWTHYDSPHLLLQQSKKIISQSTCPLSPHFRDHSSEIYRCRLLRIQRVLHFSLPYHLQKLGEIGAPNPRLNTECVIGCARAWKCPNKSHPLLEWLPLVIYILRGVPLFVMFFNLLFGNNKGFKSQWVTDRSRTANNIYLKMRLPCIVSVNLVHFCSLLEWRLQFERAKNHSLLQEPSTTPSWKCSCDKCIKGAKLSTKNWCGQSHTKLFEENKRQCQMAPMLPFPPPHLEHMLHKKQKTKKNKTHPLVHTYWEH